MNTILYRIPDKYFPGVKVTEPFHARVKYDYNDGEVKIHEATMSPLCLTHIDNTKAMVMQMKEDIEAAERKKGEVHPTIMQSLSPFIKTTP